MDGEDVGVNSGSPGTENLLHFHKDRDVDGEEAYTNTVEGRSYESSAKIRSVGMGGKHCSSIVSRKRFKVRWLREKNNPSKQKKFRKVKMKKLHKLFPSSKWKRIFQ